MRRMFCRRLLESREASFEDATGDVNVDWPGATGVGPGCMVAPKAANLENRPSNKAPTFSMEATQAGGSTGGAATGDCTGVGQGDTTGTGRSLDGPATGGGVVDRFWKRRLRLTIRLYGSWSEPRVSVRTIMGDATCLERTPGLAVLPSPANTSGS